jgi:hypothetical protein
MSPQEIEQLALDTLYERRRGGSGCFVWNEAGNELAKLDVEAMPVLERVIVDRVCPAYSATSVQSFYPLGLGGLLGAYLVAGSRANPRRVVDFLAVLPEALLKESIAYIPAFFGKIDGRYVAPPHELLEFVRMLTSSKSEELRHTAQRSLKLLSEVEGTAM